MPGPEVIVVVALLWLAVSVFVVTLCVAARRQDEARDRHLGEGVVAWPPEGAA